MKKLSSRLEIMVPTHVVNISSDPYIKNEMLPRTIESCHTTLKLEDVQFSICIEPRFWKEYPEIMQQYHDYVGRLASQFTSNGINVRIKEDVAPLLRGNWKRFVETCEKPYMMFLEHDWDFVRYVDTSSILDCFDNHDEVNYVRLSRFDLDSNYYKSMCSYSNWDWICEEAREKDYGIPLTKISFFSGNPHFARVDFCRDFIVPALEKYCPLTKSKGASHLEKDIKKAEMYMIDEFRSCGFSNNSTDPGKSWGHQWPLSHGPHSGKDCPDCRQAIQKQQKIWGNFMYGHEGETNIVSHLGDWCMKC